MPRAGNHWYTQFDQNQLDWIELIIQRPNRHGYLKQYDLTPNPQGLPKYLLDVVDALKTGIDTPREFSTLHHLRLKTALSYYSVLAQQGLIVRTKKRHGVRYALAAIVAPAKD